MNPTDRANGAGRRVFARSRRRKRKQPQGSLWERLTPLDDRRFAAPVEAHFDPRDGQTSTNRILCCDLPPTTLADLIDESRTATSIDVLTANGRLWLLNSRTGGLGHIYLDDGRFKPIRIYPGRLRGSTFVVDHTVVLRLSAAATTRLNLP